MLKLQRRASACTGIQAKIQRLFWERSEINYYRDTGFLISETFLLITVSEQLKPIATGILTTSE